MCGHFGLNNTLVELHIPSIHTTMVNVAITALAPLILAILGAEFLSVSFVQKTWPPPLIAFIFFISATLTSMQSSFTVCQASLCDDYQVTFPALTYVFGGLAILSLLLLFLRVLNAWGDNDAPEAQV